MGGYMDTSSVCIGYTHIVVIMRQRYSVYELVHIIHLKKLKPETVISTDRFCIGTPRIRLYVSVLHTTYYHIGIK